VQCPYCHPAPAETSVTETRVTADGMRRRRMCSTCKRRFTTYERVGSPGIKVHKRDGRVVAFERDKIVRALARVTARRGVDETVLERIATDLEAALVDDAQKTVTWAELARLVHARLANVDAIAAQRFAADYTDDAGELRFGDVAAPAPSPQLGLPLPEPE
jgi:transcriptional repressor NrdR